ncbi:hypothetical protein Tco_0897647, partial [Tanacetum coccineum]
YKPVEAFKSDLEGSPPEAIDERCKVIRKRKLMRGGLRLWPSKVAAA